MTRPQRADSDDYEDNFDEEVETIHYEYKISSYGADYPVDGLVKRIKRGDIFIPPFQRKYVWKLPQASRFIESLLLGLPIPGIFLGRQESSNRLLIIDGQQRLLTLQYYYHGVFADTKREFALTGVQPNLEGLTYIELPDDMRRRLDDAVVHATIVKQEEPEQDDHSFYLVFERLNTGGTPLSPQEIRSCVSFGPLIKLLAELNEDSSWRNMLGKKNVRMRDEELILRTFALLEGGEYSRPMKTFLNSFAARRKDIERDAADRWRQVFQKTVKHLDAALGSSAFRPKAALNIAVADSVLVATASLVLANKEPRSPESLLTAYQQLMSNPEFEAAYSRSTTDDEQVKTRLRIAKELLAHGFS